MSKVTVYRFKLFTGAGEYEISRRMATRESIERTPRLELMDGSGMEVDCADVDGNGMTASNCVAGSRL
jgi:hypothetical protein